MLCRCRKLLMCVIYHLHDHLGLNHLSLMFQGVSGNRPSKTEISFLLSPLCSAISLSPGNMMSMKTHPEYLQNYHNLAEIKLDKLDPSTHSHSSSHELGRLLKWTGNAIQLWNEHSANVNENRSWRDKITYIPFYACQLKVRK